MSAVTSPHKIALFADTDNMRVLCALFLTILPATAQEFTVAQLVHQPLTNENIVTLAKAGFDELFILHLIRSSRTTFDTSVQGLVDLKKAGVSQDLIHMMAMPLVVAPTATPEKAPEAPASTEKKHWSFFKSVFN